MYYLRAVEDYQSCPSATKAFPVYSEALVVTRVKNGSGVITEARSDYAVGTYDGYIIVTKL